MKTIISQEIRFEQLPSMPACMVLWQILLDAFLSAPVSTASSPERHCPRVQVWPAMAQWFGVETGPPLKIPLPVFMPQHKETWSHIRKKYHLKDLPYDHVRDPPLVPPIPSSS